MNATRESANLDFLRGMAVLFVLIDHVFVFFGEPQAWFFQPRILGILGVLLFFVHTCLVLMFSLERQEAKFGRANMFRIFMIRRCFRVYPLSMLIVTLIYVFQIPQADVRTFGFGPMPVDFGGFVSNLLLVQNITDSRNILLPLWSLPYEMQMYLFLPALFLWIRSVRSMLLLLALWVLALAVSVVQFSTGLHPKLLWLVPAFFPGVIAYWASKRYTPRLPFWLFGAGLVVGALVFMAAPGPGATFKGMPFCLALGFALPWFTELQNPWLRRASHLLAKYSYGIYMTHMLCQWAAFVLLRHLAFPVQAIVFVALLAGVPVFLYHTVENPMIRLGNRWVERRYKARGPEPSAVLTTDAASVP